MRILFLTERFPWPLEDGGNQRSFYLLKALASRHEVTLLSHHPQSQPREAIAEIEKYAEVRTIASPRYRLMRIAATPWRWNQSLFVLKNWSAPLLREAQRLIAERSINVVHFNHLDVAAFLLRGTWPTSVFDSHNCISKMVEELAADTRGGWLRHLYRREARMLRHVESAVCRETQAVMACSENDRKAFLELEPTANVHVVPNGGNVTQFDTRESNTAIAEAGSAKRIVFVGAMDYGPNVAGVQWFVEEIYPRIWRQHPDVIFQVVGRNPVAEIERLDHRNAPSEQGGRIEVTGRVAEVSPYYRAASVVVVPLRHGGGTRLKIIEAFAAGKAVVATRKGAEGIASETSDHIVIEDEPEHFAEAVCQLIRDPARARQFGDRARTIASSTYDWRAIGRKVDRIYESLHCDRV